MLWWPEGPPYYNTGKGILVNAPAWAFCPVKAGRGLQPIRANLSRQSSPLLISIDFQKAEDWIEGQMEEITRLMKP
ncbi:MAG: hypothetical protein WCI11_06120 [Candidatus Methylumidiphilus sp.]